MQTTPLPQCRQIRGSEPSQVLARGPNHHIRGVVPFPVAYQQELEFVSVRQGYLLGVGQSLGLNTQTSSLARASSGLRSLSKTTMRMVGRPERDPQQCF